MSEMASKAMSIVTFGLSDVAGGKKPFESLKGPKASGTEAGGNAKREAEQKALLDQQEEENKKSKRAAALAAPTSGFGPNTNLARSFLTSL